MAGDGPTLSSEKWAVCLTRDSVRCVRFRHLAKHLFVRRRPYFCVPATKRKTIPAPSGVNEAFPSRHAILAASLAGAVARSRPNAKTAAWLAAALVIASRMALLAHWPSDVLAGSLIGASLEAGLWRFQSNLDDGVRVVGRLAHVNKARTAKAGLTT